MRINRKSYPDLLGGICLFLLTTPILLFPVALHYNYSYLRSVEKRRPEKAPKIESLAVFFDNDFYSKFDPFLSDRMAFRGSIIQTKRLIDVKLLRESRIGAVDIGQEVNQQHWMFLIQSYWDPAVQTEEAAREVVQLLNEFLVQSKQYKAEFRLAIAPDKHTIYPEYLNQKGRYDIQQTSNARKIFHDWFGQTNDSRIINLWSELLAEKKRTDALLYGPTDTHHTYVGAMVMLREIIESIDPSLWNEENIVPVGQKSIYDLNTKIGVVNPDAPIDILEVQRPGVKVEKVFLGDQELENLSNYQEAIANANRRLLARAVMSSQDQPLIPGKTLVIHDSFIHSFLRPSIMQFFEDVSFIHHSQVTSKMFETALKKYDYVILETVERHAFGNELAQDNVKVLNRLLTQPGQQPNEPK